MEMSDMDLLNYAVNNGIIDVDTIKNQIEMNERNNYLRKHPYSIWQGKDGQWYTYFPDNEKGRKKKKRKTEKDIQNLVVQYWKDAETEVYLQDIFNQWIEKKLKWGEIQRQTYDRYESDFVRYFKTSQINRIKIQNITENDLEDFIKQTIRDQQLTRKNWSNMRIILKGIFSYAKKQKYTSIVISQFISELSLPKNLFRKTEIKSGDMVFTEEEIQKIFNLINQKEHITLDYLGIMLGFETGLRIGELAALKYSDIDGEKIKVHRTEIRYKDADGKYIYEVRESAKTQAGNREVYLTDSALKTIRRIRQINPFGEYVFMKDGKRIKARNFTRHLYLLCEKAGLSERSMHKARKTYGTNLINGNVDEAMIIEQMGHVDLTTTKNYYYYNNKKADEKKVQLEQAINY